MTVVRVTMEFGSDKSTVLEAIEGAILLVKAHSEELANCIVSVSIRDGERERI